MSNNRPFGNFMPSISLDQPLPGIDDMLEVCQRQNGDAADSADTVNLHERSQEWESLLAMAIEEKTLKAKIDAKRRDSAVVGVRVGGGVVGGMRPGRFVARGS